MQPSSMTLPDLDTLLRVEDLRRRPRFLVQRPLYGRLLDDRVSVRDMSAGGIGLSHPTLIKVGSRCKLELVDDEFNELVPLRVRTMWSHLSKERNKKGDPLYHSGMRIEDDLEVVGAKLGRLLRYYGKPEPSSMEAKKIHALSKLMRRVTTEQRTLLDLDPADVFLSYKALNDASRMGDDERADLARAASEMLASSPRPGSWSQDVLVAWKSIEGRIDLETIDSARKILVEIDRLTSEPGRG